MTYANGRGRSFASVIECSVCGDTVDLDYFSGRERIGGIMRDSRMCFKCAFWKDRAERPEKGQEVINGFMYVLRPYTNETRAYRWGGRKTLYIVRGDGTVGRSNDVWLVGEVPEAFRGAFPDTARVVTKKAYYKFMISGGFKCRAKGCWDRYRCYWYDMSVERKDGPWNTVPDSHREGDELCESYLNKRKIWIKPKSSSPFFWLR